MTTIDSASDVLVPKLKPEEIKGLRDFCQVYELHHKEISAELLYLANEYPESKFILQSSHADQSAEPQGVSLELLRRAIYHGEWEPYIKNLQSQGRKSAQAGLP